MAVHGTRHRESVSWNYAGLLQFLESVARDRTGLPLLRCYWYEATLEGRRSAEHDALADLPGVKLRLGRMRPGRREGVESEIHRDLITLARNGALQEALLVSAEEDLEQVIADVQDLGVRVTLVHITVGGNWTISRSLRQECDDVVEVNEAHLRPYVELVVGAEPLREDERDAVGAHSGRVLTNGHGSVGPLGQQQALPAGSHPAPEIYTGPVIAEYQRAAQPTMNGQPGSPQHAGPSGPAAMSPSGPQAPQPGQPQVAQSGQPQVSGPGQPQVSGPGQPRAPQREEPPMPRRRQPRTAVPAPAGSTQHETAVMEPSPGIATQPAMPPAQQPVPAGQQPLPGGQQPLPGGQQPLPGGQQPLPGGQQGSSAPTAQPAVPTIQPAAQGQETRASRAMPQQSARQQDVSQQGVPHQGVPQQSVPQHGVPQHGMPQPAAAAAVTAQPGPAPPAPPAPLPQRTPAPPARPSAQHAGAEPAPGGAPSAPQPGPPVPPGPPGSTGQHPVPSRPGMRPSPAQQGHPGMAPPPAPPPGVQAGQPVYPAPPPYHGPQADAASGPAGPAPPPGGGVPGAPPPQQAPYAGLQPAESHVPMVQQTSVSLADAVQAAHGEGFNFGHAVAHEAPALWLEAVLARKPRMPSDLEAKLLQDSELPIDSLLHDEVRHALRRGFWDALERARS